MQTGAVEVWCFVFSMVWLSSGQIFQQLSDYCGTPKRATVKAGVAWVDPRRTVPWEVCSCSQAGICEFLRGYPHFVRRQGKHGKTWRGYAAWRRGDTVLDNVRFHGYIGVADVYVSHHCDNRNASPHPHHPRPSQCLFMIY